MCGIPGSGKTTWVNNWILETQHDCRYVSRDEIRFSMLQDEEDYFSHEKEVFQKFIETIKEGLKKGIDVVADATHLTPKSRRRVLYALQTKDIDFNTICVCMDTPLDICWRRNLNRQPDRAFVPCESWKSMCDHLEWPHIDEDESIVEIWRIRGNE